MHRNQRREKRAGCVRLERLEGRQLLSAGSDPADLIAFDGKLFFTADNGINGRELWVSDGSPGGTSMVKDINPGQFGSNIRRMTVVGNKLFFAANNGTNGQELWVTDGTSANTKLVKDIWVGSTASFPDWLSAVGNTLYFSASTSANGNEVWKSDGTANGTVMVADVAAGTTSSYPTQFTQVGSNVFFSAEGVTTSGNKKKPTTTRVGIELFVTNGTAAGTRLVKDIDPGFSHSMPSQLIAFNSKLYFTASSSGFGWELWSSDGTAAGTNIVKDLFPGYTGSNPSFLRKFNGSLWFNAQAQLGGGPTGGLRLWKSDGTAAGTVTGNSMTPGFTGFIPANFDFANGLVFFESEDMEGLKLYRTDGTAAGTFSLAVQQSHAFMQTGEIVTQRRVVGNKVFFTVANTAIGNELHVTDGSLVGTKLVKDIFPGTNPFDIPSFLTEANGKLFFTADDGTNGRELWISDGSPQGTSMVKDIFG